VLEPDPSSLINVTLKGPPFSMPGFRTVLNDQDVADVVTYLRSAWHKVGSV
jgi:mono/diheme cytochrome c family protein